MKSAGTGLQKSYRPSFPRSGRLSTRAIYHFSRVFDVPKGFLSSFTVPDLQSALFYRSTYSARFIVCRWQPGIFPS